MMHFYFLLKYYRQEAQLPQRQRAMRETAI